MMKMMTKRTITSLKTTKTKTTRNTLEVVQAVQVDQATPMVPVVQVIQVVQPILQANPIANQPRNRVSLRNPYLTASMSTKDIDHKCWCPFERENDNAKALRQQNVMTTKSNPNVADFLKDLEKRYTKNNNLDLQLKGFLDSLSNGNIAIAVMDLHRRLTQTRTDTSWLL